MEIYWTKGRWLFTYIKNGLFFFWRGRRGKMWTLALTMTMIWFLQAVTYRETETRFVEVSGFDIFHIQERNPFYNLHRYRYLINSKACDNKSLTILIAVHSKPENIVKRRIHRQTIGSVNKIGNVTLSTVFFLARVTDRNLQKQVDMEAEIYGDIVQGNFIDSYANMTHKHVMLMRWVLDQCSNVKVVVKIDDDVFVHLYNLANYITTTSVSNSFHCMSLKTEIPFRNPSEKYYIPYEMYPFQVLPEYCPGFSYITTPEVYSKIYPLSRDIRYLNMDDVLVTGILAAQANVKHKDIFDRMIVCKESTYRLEIRYRFSSLIFLLNEDNECVYDTLDLWPDVVKKIKGINLKNK